MNEEKKSREDELVGLLVDAREQLAAVLGCVFGFIIGFVIAWLVFGT